MEINLIPLKAIVYFDPQDYVQYCEDNGTNPSLDGFDEYVSNQMKQKGFKNPFIEKDWLKCFIEIWNAVDTLWFEKMSQETENGIK